MRTLPFLFLAACSFLDGSGNVVRQDRTVPTFEAVAAQGPMDVEVDVGGEQGLALVCDDNLLEHILTEVDDGVLEIRVENDVRIRSMSCVVHVRVPELRAAFAQGSGDLLVDGAGPELELVWTEGSGDTRVRGTAIALDELTAQGSGDVSVDGIDTAALDLHLEGSGSVAVTGFADWVTVLVEGSGGVDGTGLVAADADIEVTGSGNVHLEVQGHADVVIAGSGDVVLDGDPTVDAQITGSGQVR